MVDVDTFLTTLYVMVDDFCVDDDGDGSDSDEDGDDDDDGIFDDE